MSSRLASSSRRSAVPLGSSPDRISSCSSAAASSARVRRPVGPPGVSSSRRVIGRGLPLSSTTEQLWEVTVAARLGRVRAFANRLLSTKVQPRSVRSSRNRAGQKPDRSRTLTDSATAGNSSTSGRSRAGAMSARSLRDRTGFDRRPLHVHRQHSQVAADQLMQVECGELTSLVTQQGDAPARCDVAKHPTGHRTAQSVDRERRTTAGRDRPGPARPRARSGRPDRPPAPRARQLRPVRSLAPHRPTERRLRRVARPVR